jgi:hypothetical protein
MNNYMLPIGLLVVVGVGGYVYMQGHKSLPQLPDTIDAAAIGREAVCKATTFDELISAGQAYARAHGRPEMPTDAIALLAGLSKEDKDKYILNTKTQAGCFTL